MSKARGLLWWCVGSLAFGSSGCGSDKPNGHSPGSDDTPTAGESGEGGVGGSVGEQQPPDDAPTLGGADTGPDVPGAGATAFAPPLARDIATNLSRASSFLYQGKNAPQRRVKKGAIDPLLVAVVRGHVATRDGAPLAGVRVTAVGHPELGYTLTRDDGLFDFAVNGGSVVTLELTLADYLPVQRTVLTRPHRYEFSDDVVLIARDRTATSINTEAASAQVARGSVVNDASGSRQATLAFRPETQAFAVLPDGSEEPLSKLTVRATEFTVGDSGVAAMPGNLPATSGYTYALELSVDEADALSARHVRFTKPVAFYLENFLHFPVGELVPAGFYDRDAAAWQPSDSGVVLQVLDVTGGVAKVDLNGDGVAEDDVMLSDAGIEAQELEQLAKLYEPGQSLWRVELDHFSSWDYNWPFGPPDDAAASPYASEPPPDSDKDSTACGSIIHCESQVLGEKFDLVGTPLSLNYQTNRTPGRRAAFETDIRLSGDTVPDSLKAIALEISIEGQRHLKRFAPKPGLSEHFVWDGRDGYGRLLQGQHLADIRVGYVYDGVYKQGTRFGASSGVSVDGSKTRQEVTLWRDQPRTLGTFDAGGLGLGGLMLAEHHAYDPNLQVLYQGNGAQRSARSLSHVLQEIYVAPPIHLGPSDLLAAPDGGLYMSDDLDRVLYRSPSGEVQVVAGTGEPGFSGDGGPATEAQLYDPSGLALKPDGTLLIADSFNGRIRAVTPDGKIETIAGGGSEILNDGLPALQADISVADLVYAPDGSLYFTGNGGGYIRRLAPDGILETVAGRLGGGVKDPDAEIATDAYLTYPAHLRRGPDGSLYFTESFINHRLRRLWPSGRLETLASEAEGIGNPAQIELMPDGSILLAQNESLLRFVPGQGLVPFLGGGDELAADGVIAETAHLSGLRGLARGQDNSLYLTAPTEVYRVPPAMPSLSLTDVVLPSVDGQQLFVFSGEGRHLATRDALTGIEQWRFEYDGPWLVGIRDAFDVKTTLERDQDGTLLAIVGPDGQRNEVALDDTGRLTALTDPIGRVSQLGYDEAGLLSELTDRRGGVHRFGYDDSGRLTSDEGPTGFLQTLERASTETGFTVSLKTPLGRTRRYSIERTPEGNERRRLVSPDGSTRQTTRSAARLETLAPDGTLTQQQLTPDKRFAMQTPRSATIQTTPGGRTLALSQETQFTPADLANPFGLGKTIQLSSRAGLTTTTTYDAATRQLSIKSPAGRLASFVLGPQGEVVETTQPGLATSYFEYDDRGHLLTAATGSGPDARSTTFNYASDGLLSELTDALGHTTALTRDGAGRVTASSTSAGTLALAYDEHDNLTQVTPPGRKPYQFGFDAADLPVSSTEPSLASKRFASSAEYTADLELAKTTSADSQVIERAYDDAGRLASTQLPSGMLSRSYSAQGQLSKLATPQGDTISFTYDGPLLESTTTTGTAPGTIHYDYDDAWRVSSTAVNANAKVSLSYDTDNLLTAAGPVQVKRATSSGLPTTTTVSNASTAFGYNPFGELATLDASFKSTALLHQSYARDALGRIAQLSETNALATTVTDYAYDDDGRLTGESQNGRIRSYTYDANGNRLSVDDDGTVTQASYDAQDRILTYGTRSFTHDRRGNLTDITDGDATTHYTYDALDRLTQVTLPDGRVVDYVIDARGRRIARKLNGTLTAAYLYDGQLRPRAQLDAAGTVTAEFVYANGINVPDAILTGGKTYAVLRDHLGSVRLVVDAQTGAIAQQLAYDAFGQVTQDTSPGFQPFGFAGGLYDAATGLVHFGAREYDASIGRWVSKDPIGFEGDGPNLYAYVLSDGVNRVDSTGEGFLDCPKAIANYVKCKSGGDRSLDNRKKENDCKGPDDGHDEAIRQKNNRCERLKKQMINACKKPEVYGPFLIVGAAGAAVLLATGVGEVVVVGATGALVVGL